MGSYFSAVLVQVLAGVVVYTGRGMWLLMKLGFTATGIVKGSFAAMAMACFGNVQAGSIISQATSIAMRL